MAAGDDIPYMIVAGVLKQRVRGLDRFLLHEEADHVLQFPGGKVKTGESLGEALNRELMEEVGLVLEKPPVLIAIEHASTTRETSSTILEQKMIFFFEIECEAKIVDQVAWVSQNELPRLRHRVPYDNCLIMSGISSIQEGKPFLVPPGFGDSPATREEMRVRTFLWTREA